MLKKNSNAIYCSKATGPNFGAADFRLENNMKSGITYANSKCYFLSNNNLELIGGKGESGQYEVEELEVYKVIY